MRMYDIIAKKRDGLKLDRSEIEWFIRNYISGKVPDYQAAALLMAIYINGMDEEETAALTAAMAHSGDIMDLSDIPGIKVDKHSTGGVGDKTTLVVAPLVASLGVPIAKMSGGSLGYTGGTKDKLDSIPGFRTWLSKDEFITAVQKHNIALIGQTENIAVADKKLYALRDSIAAVESIPLIASSIMSKKIAAGADAIVLDVKVGNGAFMKDLKKASELAQQMVKLGHSVGKKVIAVITSMEQPLGQAVGNAIEVQEAVETLKGHGPADLLEVSLTLGSYMLILGGKAYSVEEARKLLQEAIEDGLAIRKFKELLESQGGNADVAENPSLLPQAEFSLPLICQYEGYVQKLNAGIVGKAAAMLGISRESRDDKVDYAAGIKLFKKIGDVVHKGQELAVLYSNCYERLKNGVEIMQRAYSFSDVCPAQPPLIYDVIDH